MSTKYVGIIKTSTVQIYKNVNGNVTMISKKVNIWFKIKKFTMKVQDLQNQINSALVTLTKAYMKNLLIGVQAGDT